jgi:hypothetical protein
MIRADEHEHIGPLPHLEATDLVGATKGGSATDGGRA